MARALRQTYEFVGKRCSRRDGLHPERCFLGTSELQINFCGHEIVVDHNLTLEFPLAVRHKEDGRGGRRGRRRKETANGGEVSRQDAERIGKGIDEGEGNGEGSD